MKQNDALKFLWCRVVRHLIYNIANAFFLSKWNDDENDDDDKENDKE